MGLILSPEPAREHIPHDPFERKRHLDAFECYSMGRHIMLPWEFLTDGSSIPDLALWFAPKYKCEVAGWVHDWGYFIGWPRKECDLIWKDLGVAGFPHLTPGQAGRGYCVLRGTGWYPYHGHRTGRLGQGMDKPALIDLSETLLRQSPNYGLPPEQMQYRRTRITLPGG